LEATLRALGADASQWERALSLVEAPRAVARLRQEAGERNADLVGLAGHAPTTGDLLRAMRLRRRRTVEQVATGLGVSPRSVRRWERSEAALPEERIDDLCRLLSVTPEERVALSQQRLWLWTPEWQSPPSLEAAEQQCERLVGQMHQGEMALMDLRLLSLEAQLWPEATQNPSARRVLSRVFATHAQYLEGTGRATEVSAYSDRALDLLAGKSAPERWWFLAVHGTGYVLAAHLGAQQRYRRQVEYLRRWLDLTDDPFWQTSLYRDMADYALQSGQVEASLGWIGKAEALAERVDDDPVAFHLARHVHVKVLVAAGRPKEALRKLSSQGAVASVHQQLYDAFQQIEVFQALGDHNEAQVWLNRAYAHCQENGLSTWGVDALARRF
jgi:transcriptional regulator with XRE-family HTH domain